MGHWHPPKGTPSRSQRTGRSSSQVPVTDGGRRTARVAAANPCHGAEREQNRHHRIGHHRRHHGVCPARTRPFSRRARQASLCRDGNLLRQRRPAIGQQCRGLEQLADPDEGFEVDAAPRRPAAAEPAAQPAQVQLARRVRRPHAALPYQYHRHDPARDRGAPPPVLDRGKGRHRVRSGAPRHPPHLSHQGEFRRCHPGQPATAGRRARSPAGDAGGDVPDRADDPRPLLRRLLHAVGCHW